LTYVRLNNKTYASNAFYNIAVNNIIGLDEFFKNPFDNMELVFTGLKTPVLDLKSWDVSEVHSMSGLFSGVECDCIDISGWNTHEVWSIDNMFSDCTCKNIIGLEDLDFSNVTNANGSFRRLRTDKVILRKWGVDRDELSVARMFYAAKINYVEISGLDVSKAKSSLSFWIQQWFSRCKINTLDIRGVTFPTCRPDEGSLMFQASNIEHLYIGSELADRLADYMHKGNIGEIHIA
jgi:hypothetical protein